jgi:hypothetical protein
MSWQTRAGRQYFYAPERKDGRAVNRYVGRGPAAELVAAHAEDRKESKARARQELRATRQLMLEFDSLVTKLDVGARELLDAHLRSAGYYRIHRQWRGKRRVRSLASAR